MPPTTPNDLPQNPTRRTLLRLLGGLPMAGLSHSALAVEPALPTALRSALAQAGIEPGSCSFVAQWLDEADARVRWQAGRPMAPASVLKLVTTYVGLQVLGPQWRWQTPVYATGPLRGGVLDGDLVLVGSGDPHLVSEDLWHLVQRLHGLGLRRLRGRVVVDRSLYALPRHDPGAFDGDAAAPYNAGPDPLLFNFDALSVALQPAGAGVAVSVEPPQSGFAPRRLPRLELGPCGDWKRALRADWSDPLHPSFAGRYARACGVRTWNLRPDQGPDALLRSALGALFTQAGIRWSGSVVTGPLPAGAQLLTQWDSLPLVQLVQDINKFSNNVMCEQLFLQIGLQAFAAPATYDKSARAVADWLAQHGLQMPELILDNGCGLSRRARVSADSLNRLLRAAWSSPLMPEFIASLPLAGRDGTLLHRDLGAAGLLHAKTGNLDGVLSLAGYLQTPAGRRASVVALVNAPRAAQAWNAFDTLLQTMLHSA